MNAYMYWVFLLCMQGCIYNVYMKYIVYIYVYIFLIIFRIIHNYICVFVCIYIYVCIYVYISTPHPVVDSQYYCGCLKFSPDPPVKTFIQTEGYELKRVMQSIYNF